MRLKFSPEVSALLELIEAELPKDQDLYVVGGAVRDLLLGRKLHDLDFVMSGDPTSLAKKIAKRLKAGFFVLDDERHTARIVNHRDDDQCFPLDFVQFTGGSLLEDLKKRDFTINAMAISIRERGTLVDPLGGQDDLKSGWIRPCSERALLDDPVRVLRGIRLAVQFNYDYVKGLDAMMREAAPHLTKTSNERQRDEFFRILEGPAPSVGLEHCRQFKVFETLIPSLIEQEGVPASPPHVLPLFDHTLSVVDRMHLLLGQLTPDSKPIGDEPWWLRIARVELQQFSEVIKDYFDQEITLGRTKYALALLGALLHDIGKPLTIKEGDEGRLHYYNHDKVGAELTGDIAKGLRLSNAESDWLQTMVRYHMRLLPLVNSDDPPDRRSVYRFFNKTGEVGVSIAILSLADTLATYDHMLTKSKWENAVRVTKVMLTAWWDYHDTVVYPTLLLDGRDLQKIFGLEPGKAIGRLLDKLLEAQASGEVLTQEEAEDFIQKHLSDNQ